MKNIIHQEIFEMHMIEFNVTKICFRVYLENPIEIERKIHGRIKKKKI